MSRALVALAEGARRVEQDVSDVLAAVGRVIEAELDRDVRAALYAGDRNSRALAALTVRALSERAEDAARMRADFERYIASNDGSFECQAVYCRGQIPGTNRYSFSVQFGSGEVMLVVLPSDVVLAYPTVESVCRGIEQAYEDIRTTYRRLRPVAVDRNVLARDIERQFSTTDGRPLPPQAPIPNNGFRIIDDCVPGPARARTYEIIRLHLARGSAYCWRRRHDEAIVDGSNRHRLTEFSCVNQREESREVIIWRLSNGGIELPVEDFVGTFARPDGSTYSVINGIPHEHDAAYDPETYAQRQEEAAQACNKSFILLSHWLNPQQLEQFNRGGSFDVIGGTTGRRYRIRTPGTYSVAVLGSEGSIEAGICFVPKVGLPAGDIMHQQKLALEHDEVRTLEIANWDRDSLLRPPGWRRLNFYERCRDLLPA